MANRNDTTREMERRLQRMNRRVEEMERKMERRMEDLQRQFDNSMSGPSIPDRPPEGGAPPVVSPFEGSDQQSERSPGSLPDVGAPVGPGGITIDIVDEEEEFVVKADIPGFDREEITLRLDNDVLYIETEHEEPEEEEEQKTYVRRERRRSMNRSVALPGPVAEDEVSSAQYEKGVLTVRLPQADPSEGGSGMQIDIE